MNPILGDPCYTHTYVNLDYLIEKADEFEFPIPDQLRKQSPKASSTKSVIQSKGHPSYQIQEKSIEEINLDLNFDRDEQFPLIKMAPVILKYLRHDPAGKFLFENKSNTVIKKELCRLTKMKAAHIDHIWRIIIPPNEQG
ncbi:hypothetical protein BHECKSOX_2405 [Bathymodiolus heckerae thiotrophic gill symbiont]|uniref:hypothetical protein n=1 Tax=Bathymodiolus heckerae thiotrophic gill symbiont TaxID=1052212 RepID=UPI0010B6175B|nr:hypothetical protein [Bathymodiolus heckerae thiotrophic gill symbiont]SHN93275.1 hypothetical protein BHECKSOX_2405 [Bathymodiolus heckerae thiotrophic gill symbiont]